MGQHGGARRFRHLLSAVVVAPALALPVALAPTAVSVPSASARTAEARSEVVLREARLFALRQLARTDRRLRPGRFPTVAPGARWHTSGTDGWLAGFYPARLWMAYEASGRPVWARRATTRQAPLRVRAGDPSTHDLGFLLQTSFGRAATLTGRPSARALVRRAAATLAGRWVPRVGAIRSWDGPEGRVTVIVDNLVNLELLFAASRWGGPREWHDLAVQHALTTAAQHLRADGSTTHVVRFSEATGQPVWRGTVQGLRDGSTWARGHSWAVYGFTLAFRESSDARLLDAARRTADFALAHLPPDGVPFWDYDAPAAGDRTRDTTAAAALASGLLELARIDPDPAHRARYAAGGLRTLRSLAGPRYLARGTRSPAVVLHGHHSAGYPDSGVTYGDHYLLEALLRAQLLPSTRPALPARVSRPGAARARADLRSVRRVSAVSLRWRGGADRAVRFRIATSTDGRTWSVARRAVSSGRVTSFETYDVPDRTTRHVRVTMLGPATSRAVHALRVRG